MSRDIPGSVLLIGAGGLGCGAAFALAAAGVRRIGVVDDDVVEVSNLQRQILHTDAAVGTAKVNSLAASISARFPATTVITHAERFTTESAPGLLVPYDVLIDGSDNLATKFAANDAAVRARKPLIHGAAVGTMGQLLTVRPGGGPCYRCLFEAPPPPDADAPSCAEAGVLGPVPGVIGALQAMEAISWLCGMTSAFSGQLFRYDSLPLTMRSFRFNPNPACAACGEAPSNDRLVGALPSERRS